MCKRINDWLSRFRLKRPGIFHVVILITSAILMWLFFRFVKPLSYIDYNKLNSLSNESYVILAALLGALVGAVVGGFINYVTTIQSIKKSNYAKSSIINKRTIYEPLFIELRELFQALLKKNSIYLSYDAKCRTLGSIKYEVWFRIKQDARFFQIPEHLKNDLLKLEDMLKQYIRFFDVMVDDAYCYLYKQLKIMGHEIDSHNETGIKSFIEVDEIINNEKDIASRLFEKGIAGMPKYVTEEEKQSLNQNFNKYISSNELIPQYEVHKAKLLLHLKSCIETIELIINTIIKKFEKQSNLF